MREVCAGRPRRGDGGGVVGGDADPAAGRTERIKERGMARNIGLAPALGKGGGAGVA